MRGDKGLPLLPAAHSATCLTITWGLSCNADVCPRHELSCVLSSDGKALSVWVEPFDCWMRTLAVENFFYNLKRSKQPHLLLSATVAWLKAGKMDLRLRLWLWKPVGDMFLPSLFFSDWVSSRTDILVSAFYTIGVGRVKAFSTIETAEVVWLQNVESWPAGMRWFEARDGVEGEEKVTDCCVVNSEKGKRRKEARDADWTFKTSPGNVIQSSNWRS